jgi:hypothetical protein
MYIINYIKLTLPDMEPLADPENDRAIKEIIPPPHRPISDDLLYPNKCTI